MPLSDPRFICLTQWLEKYFGEPVSISLVSGDASFRRYFRVIRPNSNYIAVDSPVDLVPIDPFIEMANAYTLAGLKVPKVIATDKTQGFMLLSDLGDIQLLNQLTENTVHHYYSEALNLLPKVTRVNGTTQHALPQFDQAFILKELNIFNEWLLEFHLNLKIDSETQTMLDTCFEDLTNNALQQPQYAMHRDYHSRNIMLQDNQLHLIDFQDTVIGPVTYDAVSLLRDCYIIWPEECIQQLMQHHYQLCKAHKLINESISFAQYQHWFDLMGMQRHIKIAGIFARLYHRDNKSGYLKDIPQALKYLIQVSAKYSEFASLKHWIECEILPRVEDKL
ncbi:aminoglycoside phosphotransferase [Parashewanella spongiae]|uniref:Aminoglycoside phosphotransferase n=1 Tax=Parashewanella spongiae TaxID=342950 RepID=A0A3A6TZE8_9GAMM|nr:phosphotransferase [Parashewanella spongiae]MCL1076671.1 phosphotransferase [Parashewanella spongiae]RJY18515.1 aminoglycoside phosphotransferase [Parashewanella spongiae]